MSENGNGGWLSRLRQGLSRSSSRLTTGITDLFTKRRLDDAAIEELEELLITADLGVTTAAKLAADFARTRFDKEVSPEEVPQCPGRRHCQVARAHGQALGRRR